MVKKKIKIVCSFNGISTTFKLGMELFFHKSEKNRCGHVYVTQSGPKQPIHVTCDMSSAARGNDAVVCLSFIAEMKLNKDTRYKQTTCRSDYILDRIDICCRF